MFFNQAKPVFLKEMRFDKNIQAGFFTCVTLPLVPGKLIMHVTGRSYYKLYINGVFAHYGPARAAHECSRVDMLDVTGYFHAGDNAIAFEVAGYNAGCLSSTGEYSFLQAELFDGGTSIAHTCGEWLGIYIQARERYVENLSHARNACEIYRVDDDFALWRVQPRKAYQNKLYRDMPVEELPEEIRLLHRQAAMPDYSETDDWTLMRCWGVQPMPLSDELKSIPLKIGSAPEIRDGIVERPVVECIADKYGTLNGKVCQCSGSLNVTTVNPAVALDFDFKKTVAGFAGIELECGQDAVVDVVFVNKLTPLGGIDPTNTYSRSVARYKVKRGRHTLETFEPYDMRYLRVIVRNAAVFSLKRVYIRRCQSMDIRGGAFLCSDDRLNRIYDAARQALIINSFDVLMDCPGRERGGWSMDSFWTARAASMLFANDGVERDMLDNYLAESLPKYSQLVPACYPGEDTFRIHNWTIFLGLELADYYRRTGNIDFLLTRRNQIEWLVGTLSRFENKFGLLEELPEVVYVDGTISGSAAHNQPCSTGTNAAYAWMLGQLGSVLGNPVWVDRSADIFERLKPLFSFDDDAKSLPMVPDSFRMDSDGAIVPNPVSSEASHYLYLWMGLINRKTSPNFCNKLFAQFGQKPEETLSGNRRFYMGADFPVGTVMRLEALARFGEHQKLYNEMTEICGYMFAKGPGTLWEGFDRENTNASHAFPSYFALLLMREFAGLGLPDEAEKTISIQPHLLNLSWAAAHTQTRSGMVSAVWQFEKDQFELIVNIPSGYAVNLRLPDEILGWRCRLETWAGAEVILPASMKLDGLAESFTLRSERPEF